MNWQPSECKAGDIVRIKLGTIHHYGIFVSETEVIQFGMPPVPEYTVPADQIKVLATDVDTFSCGKIVEHAVLSPKEKKTAFSPDEVVSRARARLGEGGYHLLHNNCEHFVNECVFNLHRCEMEEEAKARWRNRPIFDVYVMPIADNTRTEFLCESRNREIASVRNAKGKADKCATWSLLLTALAHSFRLEEAELNFRRTLWGKWTASQAEFSLCHTEHYAVVAVSHTPCGVDAEEPKEGDVLTWTRKESTFKRNGKGRFHPDRITPADVTSVHVKPFDLLISVCGTQRAAIKIFSVAGGTVTMLNSPDTEWE